MEDQSDFNQQIQKKQAPTEDTSSIILKRHEQKQSIIQRQFTDEESNSLMIESDKPKVSSIQLYKDGRRYGNYIKWVDNQFVTIMLGPDYLCFLPTFIFFSLWGFFLMSYIHSALTNVYVIALTDIVCLGQSVSYLLVAISDPGIVHPTQSDKQKLHKTSFCRKCRFNVPENTFHCTYCDACINGYDHHCPWTSKCIGKKNLIKFYIFLFWTPIFIVYSAFAFGFTIDASVRANPNLRVAG